MKLLLVVLALAFVGCTQDPTGPGGGDIIISNVNINNAPSNGPGTPGTGAAPSAIDSVRVGFFGVTCTNGKIAPPNASGELPVGCVGDLTATPKVREVAGLRDATEIEHGEGTPINPLWTIESGSSMVSVQTVDNFFNKRVTGQAVGRFTICATVKGVRGCLEGTVTP